MFRLLVFFLRFLLLSLIFPGWLLCVVSRHCVVSCHIEGYEEIGRLNGMGKDEWKEGRMDGTDAKN